MSSIQSIPLSNHNNFEIKQEKKIANTSNALIMPSTLAANQSKTMLSAPLTSKLSALSKASEKKVNLNAISHANVQGTNKFTSFISQNSSDVGTLVEQALEKKTRAALHKLPNKNEYIRTIYNQISSVFTEFFEKTGYKPGKVRSQEIKKLIVNETAGIIQGIDNIGGLARSKNTAASSNLNPDFHKKIIPFLAGAAVDSFMLYAALPIGGGGPAYLGQRLPTVLIGVTSVLSVTKNASGKI